MDNSITISGNLTREPELRFTAGGTPVCDLGVAVNNRYQVNGVWENEVSFFNVVIWKHLGENTAASLHKGDRVTVTGRMRQRSYQTQAGDTRTVYEIVALEVAVSLRFAVIDKIIKTAGPNAAPSEAEAAPPEMAEAAAGNGEI